MSWRIRYNIPHLHQNNRSPSHKARRHWTRQTGPGSCPCIPGWTREGTTADRAETCPAAANPPAQTEQWLNKCPKYIQIDNKMSTGPK